MYQFNLLLLTMFVSFILINLFVILLIHILLAIFLNKYNEIVYNQKTIMAWIPIVNIYLLCKLTYNKTIGLIISLLPLPIILIFISNIINKSISIILGYSLLSSYFLVILVILVIGIFKYFSLKKEKTNEK